MPVARRSSVSMAKPFLMDWRGVLLEMGLPFSLISPLSRAMMPKIVLRSSVLREPTRPATPSTSPARSSNETS